MSNLYQLIKLKRDIHTRIHTFLLRQMLKGVGQGTKVDPSVWLDFPDKIRLADNVEIRRGVILIGRSKHEVGIEMDDGVHIHQYAYLDAYGGFIKLGKGVRIGHHSVIAGAGGIIIKDFSGVSGLSYVISANHIYSNTNTPFVESPVTMEGIIIGKNVWGGSGIIITDGVRIGDNAVIGAGSVVRRDVPENAVVMGNPARVAFIHGNKEQ